MKRDRFWEMTRHLYDDKITGSSTKIALGAGMGLLAAGTGVFPALAGVAATMAAASTVQGLWQNYKRSKGEITRNTLYDAQAKLIDPYANVSDETKANSYQNLYEMLDRFSKTNSITPEHFQMMENLRDKTVAASKGTQRDGEVHLLNLLTSNMVSEWADKLANKYYESAMEGKLSNRLSDSIENVQRIELARSMVDKSMLNRRYNDDNLIKREKLLEKLEALNDGLKKGFSLEGFNRDNSYPPVAISKLHTDIEREQVLLKSRQVKLSMHLWAPNTQDIAEAVANAQDGARAAWEQDGAPPEKEKTEKFKTPAEILDGHEKLYDALRHSYKERAAQWGFAEFEATKNLPKNIEQHLRYIDASDPAYSRMNDMQRATEQFAYKSLAAIAVEDGNKLDNQKLFAQRSDALIARAQLVGRYCVVCEHLGWTERIDQTKQTLSDLSNALEGIKTVGLDPATLGKWTPEEGAKALEKAQGTIEQLHFRIITNPAPAVVAPSGQDNRFEPTY